MRALWLADVLSDAGLTLKVLTGWEARGKELDDFDGPNGVMWHHTVTSPTRTDSSVDYFLGITGRADLPAPLCNYSTNRDGSVSIIAAGRANHGGDGEWRGVSGNSNWIGDEMKNLADYGTPGKFEPWPTAQLESARIATAAILNHLHRDSGWLCAHKEYALPPGRKTDPHTLSMDNERRLVAALMTGGGGGEDVMWTRDLDEAGWRALARVGIAKGGEAAVVAYWVTDGANRSLDEHRAASASMLPLMLARLARQVDDPEPSSGGVSETRVKQLIEATKVKASLILDAP